MFEGFMSLVSLLTLLRELQLRWSPWRSNSVGIGSMVPSCSVSGGMLRARWPSWPSARDSSKRLTMQLVLDARDLRPLHEAHRASVDMNIKKHHNMNIKYFSVCIMYASCMHHVCIMYHVYMWIICVYLRCICVYYILHYNYSIHCVAHYVS